MNFTNERNKTEERILKAARAVFIEKGFNIATMNDIAESAGITRTSLNYYFRTKQKLFFGIYQSIVCRIFPQIEEIAIGEAPVFSKIEAAVEVYTSVLIKNPDVILFIAGEASKNPDLFFEAVKSMPEMPVRVKNIAAEIKRSMNNGSLRKMPIEYFATTFFGLLFFPFFGKNILKKIFFKSSEKSFEKFVLERRKFIVDSMKSIFAPEKR